jgi:metal-responsive CopG/Arc/MetJ family transcriptional regulator
MNKARISMTIDQRLLERIDDLAAAQNTNRSALIERLLREAVTEEEMLDSPLIRQMVMSAMGSPSVVRSLTTVLEDALDDEQLETIQKRLSQLQKLSDTPTARKGR